MVPGPGHLNDIQVEVWPDIQFVLFAPKNDTRAMVLLTSGERVESRCFPTLQSIFLRDTCGVLEGTFFVETNQHSDVHLDLEKLWLANLKESET